MASVFRKEKFSRESTGRQQLIEVIRKIGVHKQAT
jgi:hypothetical protein